jgi:hypothetical protein
MAKWRSRYFICPRIKGARIFPHRYQKKTQIFLRTTINSPGREETFTQSASQGHIAYAHWRSLRLRRIQPERYATLDNDTEKRLYINNKI